MKTNKTCIILVNYNGFDDTKACLESISKTNGELPYVILVDNASIENKNLEDLKSVYKALLIIYNKENIGFGRANNLGINWALEHIDFNYLCLLNNDTIVKPDFLEELKKPFQKDAKIGITTGKIFYESKREKIWYGGAEIDYKKGWPKITDYNKEPSREGANQSKYVSFISGCLMLFSKASIRKLKGFDEDFFMYCEDMELCIRAKEKGIKLFYTSESILYHKVQGSLKETQANKTGLNPQNPNLIFLFTHLKTNQYITFKKHLKGWRFIRFYLYFKLHCTYLFIKFILNGRLEMINPYLKIITL